MLCVVAQTYLGPKGTTSGDLYKPSQLSNLRVSISIMSNNNSLSVAPLVKATSSEKVTLGAFQWVAGRIGPRTSLDWLYLVEETLALELMSSSESSHWPSSSRSDGFQYPYGIRSTLCYESISMSVGILTGVQSITSLMNIRISLPSVLTSLCLTPILHSLYSQKWSSAWN